MDLVDVGRHEGFSEIHLVHFHLKSINYTQSKSWPQRLSSHRGPGWSRSWRRGSRRPVSERWAAPRCGGLWSDTGPVSAADLCSSGTASLRWATAASPVSDTHRKVGVSYILSITVSLSESLGCRGSSLLGQVSGGTEFLQHWFPIRGTWTPGGTSVVSRVYVERLYSSSTN